MDPLPSSDEEHQAYLRILAQIPPGEKMLRAMELSDLGRRMLKDALRSAFPQLDEERLHRLYLERLELCHNRNY